MDIVVLSKPIGSHGGSYSASSGSDYRLQIEALPKGPYAAPVQLSAQEQQLSIFSMKECAQQTNQG